jgi:glycerol transport system ATP-binding protein
MDPLRLRRPPAGRRRRLIALVAGVRRLEPGTAVTAYLDPRHALVFDESGRTAALRGLAAARRPE